ncbi:MAG TPA: YpzG family protein [Bacillales bacterium]|nr:YpzG family protein [Bacillales bacterium]
MDEFHKKKRDSEYKDPFQSPHTNPKHAFRQVNGETQQGRHNYVIEIQTRKRT